LIHAKPLDLDITFHVYAIVYWPAHAQQCQNRITHLISEFLGSIQRPSKPYANWLASAQRLRYNDIKFMTRPWYRIIKAMTHTLECKQNLPDPILAAAYFGFQHCGDIWKPSTFNPNYSNIFGTSLLSLASG
jgi:hypothetical protein